MLAEDYQESNLENGFPQTTIKVIPHSLQRYNTVGDYVKDENGITITVSKMRPHYEFLVAIHELIEAYLVQAKGIKIEDIDAFDKRFE
jgi:hypothetical protein